MRASTMALCGLGYTIGLIITLVKDNHQGSGITAHVMTIGLMMLLIAIVDIYNEYKENKSSQPHTKKQKENILAAFE